MSDETSHFVAADSQFGIARVLKPFENFEAVYQGKVGVTPIAMPGILDPNAGEPGYASNLIAGLPVPLGSRVLIWIPAPCTINTYFYRVIWRMRTLREFRNPVEGIPRRAYHLPFTTPGVPSLGQQRFQIPAAVKVIAYEQMEPGAACDPGRLNIRREDSVPQISVGDAGPLTPSGDVAVIQQGILPDSAGAAATQFAFCPFWMDAEGDEMIVELVKGTDPLDTWDFTQGTEDLVISDLYGTGNGAHPIFPNAGILVFTGTNP